MDIKTLSNADLTSLRATKRKEFSDLIATEAPTDEQIEQASALDAEITEIDAEFSARAERTAKFEALRTKQFSGDMIAEEKDEEEEPAMSAEEPEVEAPAAEEKPTAPVAAPASVAEVAAAVERPSAPASAQRTATLIRALGEGTGFAAGAALAGLDDVTKAVIEKTKGYPMPAGDGSTQDIRKHAVASFAPNFGEGMVIGRRDSDERVMEILHAAADEKRLSGNSLVAAGGWCSPSEVMYDLPVNETLEGLVSLPEVGVSRGGIRYTPGPDFADFYATPGFKQTDAQAIAGVPKTWVTIDCPDFQEVRLDAIGIGIKVPILTNASYPENVKRSIAGFMVAHEHWVNADVIGRMVTLAGAARVFAGLGASVTDALEALNLVANQRRQKHRLSLNASLEVVVPFWLKAVYKADLSRRTGVAIQAVTDAMLAEHFSVDNLAVQFVYDWQPINEDAEVYPATYNVLIYPAGTFVRGTSDVINLSTIYDAAELEQNTFTGLFMEKGLFVAKMQMGADLLTLPICNAGRTGAANLTCA